VPGLVRSWASEYHEAVVGVDEAIILPLGVPSVGSGLFFYSFLVPPDRYFFMRVQSLYTCLTGKAWFGRGVSSIFLK
jgi:hypothetical protein